MTLPAWHAHPDVWVLFGSIIAAYLIACRRHQAATAEVTSVKARVLFLSGMAVMWLAADWPVHDLSERYLYHIHMSQHLLFSLVAAPMLVVGMPAWMWRNLLGRGRRRRVWAFFTKPLVALIVFNAALLFTHWPAIVDASVHSELVHFGLHALITVTALQMWWPVLSPLPEMPAMSLPGQMLYLFLQSLAPTVPASFLTFGDHPLYPVYATFPRIWGINVLDDQLLAGLIMKLIGGAILWGFITVIFFKWAAQENRTGLDALKFQNVKRDIRAELNR